MITDSKVIRKDQVIDEMEFDITAPNILIVDDDIKICHQLKHLIKEFGYQCGFIIQSKNLIPRLKEEKFDLVLLDLNMPEVNGIDILKKFKKNESLINIPVVMLTAENCEKILAKCYSLGAVDYIEKPISKLILEARLNNALAAKYARETLESKIIERAHDLELLNKKLIVEIKTRRTYEKDLIQSKIQAESANRAKSEFLANMSHELRTPMNAILGTTQLLEETTINEEQKELIQILKSGGERLLDLINNVLDLSKIEANKLEVKNSVFSLHKAITSSCKLLAAQAHDKSIQLHYKIDHHVPDIIKSDLHKINQIITNLLGNAIKFTNKGEVSLTIKEEKSEGNKALLLFSVSDTGVGIDKDKQDKIFESFSQVENSATRTFQGTGLGLAITKKLVNILSGEIWVVSEIKKGSTFYFTIACELINKKDSKLEEAYDLVNNAIYSESIVIDGSISNNKIQNKKWDSVLLVEDDPASRMIAKSILGKKFSIVETATNGDEAVKKFKSKKWNVVLMDMQMPLINGYEAARLIRIWENENKFEKTPIVAMTAYALDGDDKKCTDAGCSAYLSKPINTKALNSMIDSLLIK